MIFPFTFLADQAYLMQVPSVDFSHLIFTLHFQSLFLPFVSEEGVPHPMSTANPSSTLDLFSHFFQDLHPLSSASQPLHTPLKLVPLSCKRARLSSLKKKKKKRLAAYPVLSLRLSFSLTFIAVKHKPCVLLATLFDNWFLLRSL